MLRVYASQWNWACTAFEHVERKTEEVVFSRRSWLSFIVAVRSELVRSYHRPPASPSGAIFIWSGGPVHEEARTKSAFSTVEACRSVFELDYHPLAKIAQNVEAFDACGKITHGTFIGARAHMKKHSALERLSCLQNVFLRLSNARCFMIQLDTQ